MCVCVHIYILDYYYYRISHFSALAGKYSPILGRSNQQVRLGGLTCSLKSFLQLNMCQELQIFAVVCIYVCMYVFGCKWILVRLCDSDFGITPVDDITIGIIYYWYVILLLLLLLLLLLPRTMLGGRATLPHKDSPQINVHGTETNCTLIDMP